MIRISHFNAVEKFLSLQESSTARAYRHDLNHFKKCFKQNSDEDLTKYFLALNFHESFLVFKNYLSLQKIEQLAPSTINRRLSTASGFVSFLRKAGLLNYDLEVKKLKAKKYKDTKGPGKEAISLIIQNLKSNLKKENLGKFQELKILRNLLLVSYAYLLGLRRNELISLDVDDLNFLNKTVEVTAKARDEKTIMTIPTKLCNLTKRYLELRGTKPGALFIRVDKIELKRFDRLNPNSINKIFSSVGREVSVFRFQPHGVRHTAITETLKQVRLSQESPESAKSFSRHSDLNTLFLYDDELKNKQAVQSKALSQIL